MTSPNSLSSTLQHVGRTLRAEDYADTADAELVARFACDRDEAAFAALVRRHGGLVLGVCQRVLGHHQDAEDAFQATFLVLARKAGRVGRDGVLGNWLFGVAFNVARKAKAMRQKRQARDRAAAAERGRLEETGPAIDDLREVLDTELHALAEKYRTAIVLCDVMGLTIERAAGEVRCPPKTMGTRLTRGRALLAARLARRGIVVSASVLSTALASAASAAIPPRLVSSTILTATGPVVPPAVAELARGVSMTIRSVKFMALAACGVVVTAGLASHLIHAAPAPVPTSAGAARAGGETRTRPAARHRIHDFFTHVLAHIGMAHGLTGEPVDAAADEKAPPLAGVWVKKEGEMKLDFSEKDALIITPHGENRVVVLRCEAALDKDGVVKVKVAGIDGKEDAVKMIKERLPVGTEFRFKWVVDKDSGRLEELKGEKIEVFKSLLEGEFEKK